MDYEEPPRDSSEECLLSICNFLIGKDSTREDIYESDELDKKKDTLRASIKYGKLLGFIEDDESTLSLTNTGKTAGLSFENDNDERVSEQFRIGVSNYPFCRTVLSDLKEEREIGDTLMRSDVTEIFLTSPSIDIDASKKTVETKATKFLRMLESAGLGEYKRGNKSKNSRLELEDDFETVYRDLFGKKYQEEEQEESEDSVASSQERVSYQSPPQTTQQTTEQGITFDISLELSGDEDPEQIEELVASVRRGMNRNVEQTKEGDDKGGDEKDVRTEEMIVDEEKEESENQEADGDEEEPELDGEDGTVESIDDEAEPEEENGEDSDSSSSLDAFND